MRLRTVKIPRSPERSPHASMLPARGGQPLGPFLDAFS